MVKTIRIHRVHLVLIYLLLAALLLAACNSVSEVTQPIAVSEAIPTLPEASAAAGYTPTAVPTETSAPTATPAATETAVPTETPLATETAAPTITPAATSEVALTLLINADGSGDLATLEEAIAFAAGGSTIELSAGEFIVAQTLEVDKPLTINGAGIEQTRIFSEAPSASLNYSGEGRFTLQDLTITHRGNFAADLITVRSGELDLANCRLQGARPSAEANYGAGLFVLNESVVHTSSCEIIDNGGVGVQVIHDAQITLQDSIISGNGAGILFDGNSTGQVSGSVIKQNDDAGVLVFALARPDIIDNLVQDNHGYGIRYQLEDGVGGIVRGNELLSNNSSGPGATGTDIIVFDSFTPHLTGNTCRGGEGLALASGTLVTADPSGIVFFNTAVGWPDDLILEDNDCAVAFCGLSPGEDDFELQCD